MCCSTAGATCSVVVLQHCWSYMFSCCVTVLLVLHAQLLLQFCRCYILSCCVTALLVLLSTIDILLVRHAYHSTMSLGASVQLVFGFEYAILLTVVYNIGVKYLCHGIDLQSENPWENKAMYLLYMELVVGE